MAPPVDHSPSSSPQPTDRTPLLSAPTHPSAGDTSSPSHERPSRATLSLRQSFQGKSPSKVRTCQRWPSVAALVCLCLAALLILLLGFGAPKIVDEYAHQALLVEPVSMSLGELTDSGVVARIVADFTLDAARVKKKPIRDLGRFGTWIAKKIETKETRLDIRLPDYSDAVIGTATMPSLTVDIQNGHTNRLDFDSHLSLAAAEPIRAAAREWLDGSIHTIRVDASTDVDIKSGLFALGQQHISQSLEFDDDKLQTGNLNVTNFNIRESKTPDEDKALAASAFVQYSGAIPAEVNLPPIALSILVPGCTNDDSLLMLADATSPSIHVTPQDDLALNVTAFVRRLSDPLLQPCPMSQRSPLDSLLQDYIHGQDTTVFVRASDSPDPLTPSWLTELVSGITIGIPFPGHSLGHLVKNFSMTDVHFSLPDFLAKPGSPESQPKISADVKALVTLPKEMDFNFDVHRMRANADVFFRARKLGVLNLRNWHSAKSRHIKEVDSNVPGLEIQSSIRNAPLNITDDKVFTDVIKALLTSRETLNLTVNADVDVELSTMLGTFVVREIPASGEVPVKPVSGGQGGAGGNITALMPTVGDLRIVDTTSTSLVISALVNITNPTKYSATVPYFDIDIAVNSTDLGHATVRNVSVKAGKNVNIPILATWDPLGMGGKNGSHIGRELLSQYVSGFNTTLTLRTHAGSIPAQPLLGKALASLEFEIPTPKLGGQPGGGDDDDGGDEDDPEDDGRPHFIRGATMHLFTSSATFTVASPLHHSTLYITHINASAFYKGDAVGKIIYDGSIEVPPGSSETPRLPVQWNPGSVGFDAVRRALGGSLKLSAEAEVGVRVGRFEEEIWYSGGGIGAKVRP